MVGLRDDLRLALDPAAFARRLGIVPDAWQEDLLRSNHKNVLINASRQSGKSTTTAVLALHRALFRPRSLVLILAPALRQSQELFGKLSSFYKDAGRVIPAQAERRLSLELENGSRVITLPGSERTIRGFSGVDLLIVDEAARVDDALVHSVRPMLAVSGGAMIMLSTPYGKRGTFFEAWTGGDGWERYEIPATEVPRITPEFLEQERKNMPAWWFNQEYLCRFEETSDQVFTHGMIEGARSDDVEEYRFEGDEELWR